MLGKNGSVVAVLAKMYSEYVIWIEINLTCLILGIGMRRKDPYDRDSLHFAPFLLFPSPFPEQEFANALRLQPVLNELMHKVAHDRDFLTKTLAKTIKVDEFTGRLFKIFETVWDEGVAQVRNSRGVSTVMPDLHCCPIRITWPFDDFQPKIPSPGHCANQPLHYPILMKLYSISRCPTYANFD